jgi:hypothetical protein
MAGDKSIFFAQKRWTSAGVPLNSCPMKCETTNAVLTFVLGALVLLGVIFALQTINRTHELSSLQAQAVNINQNYLRLQGLLTETVAYNQKNPNSELTRILQNTR